MTRVEWVGSIATVQGSLKNGGVDGGFRVLFDIPENALPAYLDLHNLRQLPLRITVEIDDAPLVDAFAGTEYESGE